MNIIWFWNEFGDAIEELISREKRTGLDEELVMVSVHVWEQVWGSDADKLDTEAYCVEYDEDCWLRSSWACWIAWSRMDFCLVTTWVDWEKENAARVSTRPVMRIASRLRVARIYDCTNWRI